MEQGTEEWFAARLGKVTASRVSDVMAKTTKGASASRVNYQMELLCERLTGRREEGYTSGQMLRGIELEPVARSVYEMDKGIIVQEVGLIDHPHIKGFAASPDGLVLDDGCLEIKCPGTAKHINFIRTGQIQPDWQWQMVAQMACADRNWCDFVSFDDRLPEWLQYGCKRFYLPEGRHMDMLAEVSRFLTELDELEIELKQLRQEQGV